MNNEFVITKRCIHVWEFDQCINHCTCNKRQVGKAETLLRFEFFFDAKSSDVNICIVNFDDTKNMRTDCFTCQHVCAGGLTNL